MRTCVLNIHSSFFQLIRPCQTWRNWKSFSSKQQLHLWIVQKEQRRRSSTLVHSQGKGITAKHAERLDGLDFSKATFCGIRAASTSDNQFQRVHQAESATKI